MRNGTCKLNVFGMQRCPPLFWFVVFIMFIVILTHVVCLIEICVVNSLCCMCLGLKAISHHTTFRGNVECTSLTTSFESSIVFDFVSDVAMIHHHPSPCLPSVYQTKLKNESRRIMGLGRLYSQKNWLPTYIANV